MCEVYRGSSPWPWGGRGCRLFRIMGIFGMGFPGFCDGIWGWNGINIIIWVEDTNDRNSVTPETAGFESKTPFFWASLNKTPMILWFVSTFTHCFLLITTQRSPLKAKQKSLDSDTETETAPNRGFPGYSLTSEGECEMKGESFFVAIGVVGNLAQQKQMWCSFYG